MAEKLQTVPYAAKTSPIWLADQDFCIFSKKNKPVDKKLLLFHYVSVGIRKEWNEYELDLFLELTGIHLDLVHLQQVYDIFSIR